MGGFNFPVDPQRLLPGLAGLCSLSQGIVRIAQVAQAVAFALADALRDNACVMHCTDTASQLASIEASSLCTARPGR
jgi:hypothetical protein